MKTSDNFIEHYSEMLDGTYDCIDRIVLNSYFSNLHVPGGVRNWFSILKGKDKVLDTNQLIRFSGRFSRRIKAFTKSRNIPLIYFKSGERKHEEAVKLIPEDKSFTGIFAVFVARAPGLLWEVKKFENGSIDIRRKKNLSYVNHYYFQIMDPEWGHLTIKINSHPPFNCSIMLNGHEWVERRKQLQKLNIKKEGNCFTFYSDGKKLSKVADALKTKGQLEKVCNRWIYGCLWFGVNFEEQEKTGFKYRYSVYQVEYSRNLLFRGGTKLDDVFQNIIDLTRQNLDIKRLKTIFGRKYRPHNRSFKTSGIKVCIEKPDYNLTVFKIHFGKLTVKLYDKGERTLRVEVVVHNTKELKCKRSIENFSVIVEKLHTIMDNFMNNLKYSHVALIKDDTLKRLTSPSKKGKKRIAGIDFFKTRNISMMETVLSLSIKPNGYTITDITNIMQEKLGKEYSNRKACYDLRKLREKKLVKKRKGTRRYIPTKKGTQIIFAVLTILREEIPRLLILTKKDCLKNKNEYSEKEHLFFNIRENLIELEHLYGIEKAA